MTGHRATTTLLVAWLLGVMACGGSSGKTSQPDASVERDSGGSPDRVTAPDSGGLDLGGVDSSPDLPPLLPDLHGGADPGSPDASDGATGFTVTVVLDGDGSGTVSSAPAGLSCMGATCSGIFAPGTSVTLTPVPDAGSTFLGWSDDGPCPGNTPCTVMVDADLELSATFNADHNFVFVTSAAFAANEIVDGATADGLCNAAAGNSGLPGTYVAWLSDGTTSAASRLPPAARGWVRPDGRPFVDSQADLLQGKLFAPVIVDETGVVQDIEIVVATGTRADGTPSMLDCSGWGAVAGSGSSGRVDTTTQLWTDNGGVGCAAEFHLYCFGVDLSAPLVPRPGTGRLAFLSALPFVPGGGISSADDLCQGEADAAGLLKRTFKALLATDTASAASRFNVNGASWVRPDGIIVNITPTTTFTGRLRAPINVTLDGGYAGNVAVWTGALGGLSAVPPVGNTCESWSTTSGSGRTGTAAYVSRFFENHNTDPCSTGGRRLYCLEE